MGRLVMVLGALALVMSGCDKKDPGKPATGAKQVKTGEEKKSSTAKKPEEAAKKPGEAAKKPGETAKRPEEAAKKPAKRPRKPVLKVDKAKAKADHASWRQLLKEGRKASKANDYKLAVAKYQAANKLIPGHPGVMGELGWAQFHNGQTKLAYANLQKALKLAVKPSRRGALLYNLGRVLEARGDTANVASALKYYERSLAVRTNAIVQKRFDALRAKVTGVAAKGVATALATCKGIADEWGCDWDKGKKPADEDVEACGCSEEKKTVTAGGSGLEAVSLLNLGGDVGGSIATNPIYLTLKFGGMWFLGSMLVSNHNPGFGYVYSSGNVDSLMVRKLPNGQNLLVAVASNRLTDLNPGVEEVEEEETKKMHLCFLDAKRPTCIVLTLNRRFTLRALEPEDMGQEDDRTDEEKAAAEKQFSERKATFDITLLPDGKVHIKSIKGDVSDEEKKLPGTYTLSQLVKKKGVEVQRL